MKNLYSRLGIEQSAGESEVRAALVNKPELSDYATILLHGERRAVYDTTHSTLKIIGALRLRLGLDSSPSWFQKNCLDYVPAQKLARASQNPAVQAKAEPEPAATPTLNPSSSKVAAIPPAPSRPLAKQPVKWLIPVALLIIGMIVAAVLFW